MNTMDAAFGRLLNPNNGIQSTSSVYDFESNRASQIFEEAVQKAKLHAEKKYGENFSHIAFEGSEIKARSLEVKVNPIECQTIEIHFKDGTSRKIGEVLPEKTHLEELKNSEEICLEINQLIDSDKTGKIESSINKTNTVLQNNLLSRLPGPFDIDGEATSNANKYPPATCLLKNKDDIYHCGGLFISHQLTQKYFTEGFKGIVQTDKVVAISLNKEKLEQTMKAYYQDHHRIEEFTFKLS